MIVKLGYCKTIVDDVIVMYLYNVQNQVLFINLVEF